MTPYWYPIAKAHATAVLIGGAHAGAAACHIGAVSRKAAKLTKRRISMVSGGRGIMLLAALSLARMRAPDRLHNGIVNDMVAP